ncbi:MAG: glycoside hydrolase family 9 protein [Chitinophagaceae bacterium]|jgi:endoglucanase|nr:glycoside hydrolase family 9 protein [Chitinophagaceae bacterium]
MMRLIIHLLILHLPLFGFSQQSWIRINQIGYLPDGVKVAVWGGKDTEIPKQFYLVDSVSGKIVYRNKMGKNFGAYGPFKNTFRLNFTAFAKSGTYYLKAGEAISPGFKIAKNVYEGSADFVLNYMRQQQCGFNPYTNDSCHTRDGYTLYGPMPDSTRIDVVGGWHDASDYLQYSTTTANAVYHLLSAFKDFPSVFKDYFEANGLKGSNRIPDVLDAAKWGMDFLVKLHPKPNWMFNQVADDRDHMSMRMPGMDNFYGRGYERPVYFCSGLPQQRGKFMNNTKGVASTAGKFASSFALGFKVFGNYNEDYARMLFDKAFTAYTMGIKQPGNCQTASVKSPYIYAEDNYVDDMELGAAELFSLTNDKKYEQQAIDFARQEKITPWLGKDTANHYQWYPFINLGHYSFAKKSGTHKKELVQYYKEGIELVWQKARQNAFYRGVPFIWCSNNLSTSFAIQCHWYKNLSNDKTFDELMQANIDWLLGCNPWGTSMVYGLPAWGDTPVDPHAAFSHIGNMPVNGGLIDGPVYTTIYKSLIGIKLINADEYEPFQSDLVVYHDDYGDYSTNEPTMDGTASLVYLMAAMENYGRVKVKK